MTAQKIPLFSGLPQPCHDGVGAAELTSIFIPPDVDAAEGTRAFYLLHLWLKPAASVNFDVDGVDFSYQVQVYRGSVPGDVRPLWTSRASLLRQMVGDVADPTQIQGGQGVPVKVLDGYPVRGDMVVQFSSLSINGAAEDLFAFGHGTRLWGYYQRVGDTEAEQVRFIGEPSAGKTQDTGLPLKVAAQQLVTLHTFQADKIDEIKLQLAVNDYGEDHAASVFAFAGADGVALGSNTAIVSVFPNSNLLGSANAIRDPKSPADLYGVFGNNPLLKTLRVANQDLTRDVFVHGRFSRH